MGQYALSSRGYEIGEKDNLIEYLTKTIDEFFYTELINKIYKKIDASEQDWLDLKKSVQKILNKIEK